MGVYKALLDTASGLDYLHSLGVVHGDLKSANVLLKGSARDPRGFSCKIADFGLSRVLDMDATHISTRTYGEGTSAAGSVRAIYCLSAASLWMAAPCGAVAGCWASALCQHTLHPQLPHRVVWR
jgi:serine/threonine protein kinase